MSKLPEEIAAELTAEVVKARGLALQNPISNHLTSLTNYLSDDAVVKLYNAILKAVKETE